MLYLKADVTKPLSYISCGNFIYDCNWIHTKRNLDSFELIYVLKGCAYIQQYNEKFEVTAGKSLSLLPGHVHMGYQETKGEVSFYWIHFKCGEPFKILSDKTIQPDVMPLTVGSYINNSYYHVIIPLLFKPAESEKLIIQFRQLLHCTYAKNYMSLTKDYFITLVLMELSHQVISSFSDDVRDEKSRKLVELFEWLRINMNKDFSVKEIAIRFNFNKDYLCRIFKEQTGTSIIKYINDTKILKTREMLCSSELSIKEISYIIGFKDKKYFMELFKQHEGLTPSEYRKSYSGTHLNDK